MTATSRNWLIVARPTPVNADSSWCWWHGTFFTCQPRTQSSSRYAETAPWTETHIHAHARTHSDFRRIADVGYTPSGVESRLWQEDCRIQRYTLFKTGISWCVCEGIDRCARGCRRATSSVRYKPICACSVAHVKRWRHMSTRTNARF